LEKIVPDLFLLDQGTVTLDLGTPNTLSHNLMDEFSNEVFNFSIRDNLMFYEEPSLRTSLGALETNFPSIPV